MTTTQTDASLSVLRDQQHQDEQFTGQLVGMGVATGVLIVLLWLLVEECRWRRRGR